MWNLITVDTVRPLKGGSPYMMTHETFHHTFTLPLLNKYAPLTINNQQHNKEFPEFKEQLGKTNKKMVVHKNYINNNQGSYDCINRIMGKQQNIETSWLDLIEKPSSPSKSTSPPLKQTKIIEIPIQIEIEIDKKIDEDEKPKIDAKKKKKRRRKRRKNRNKRNKNHEETDKKTTKIETNLQRYDSLNNLIKKQRQRQISTDSDDSFIVFYDDNDNNQENPLTINNDNDNTPKKTIETNKKVRFADDEELCEIHPMVKWSYAYQAARKGPWEEYARDRDRFKKRIKNLEKVLLPILDKRHRHEIYQKRFTDKE